MRAPYSFQVDDRWYTAQADRVSGATIKHIVRESGRAVCRDRSGREVGETLWLIVDGVQDREVGVADVVDLSTDGHKFYLLPPYGF